MGVYILTSMFQNGFDKSISSCLDKIITQRNRFAFVASEFEKDYEKTDRYFRKFLKMFEQTGINFVNAYVVDGRMSFEEAQNAVRDADVVWLSGGDSPAQFRYFVEYRLDKIIKEHSGVIIGMSAGAINLATTSICTLASGHDTQSIYAGLGCVKISIEPHFNSVDISSELLKLSDRYLIYGMCDESMIVCTEDRMEFYGNIYRLANGSVEIINKI